MEEESCLSVSSKVLIAFSKRDFVVLGDKEGLELFVTENGF